MQAAAEAGRPLQLLSLLSVAGSLATEDEVVSVPRLRAQPSSTRPPASQPARELQGSLVPTNDEGPAGAGPSKESG